MRGHPRAQDLQPDGAGAYQGSRGNGVRTDAHNPEGEVERYQPLSGASRSGGLYASQHEV